MLKKVKGLLSLKNIIYKVIKTIVTRKQQVGKELFAVVIREVLVLKSDPLLSRVFTDFSVEDTL